MPTYVYQCKSCSRQTELFQKISDLPLKECPECGGEVRKLLFPPGIVFKGSGFHVNDYRKPDPARASEKSDSGSKQDTGSAGSSTKTAEKTPAAAGSSSD